jgi:hypothetical protein
MTANGRRSAGCADITAALSRQTGGGNVLGSMVSIHLSFADATSTLAATAAVIAPAICRKAFL